MVEIRKEVLQAIVDYLSTQPYSKVVVLMNNILEDVRKDADKKEVKPHSETDTKGAI